MRAHVSPILPCLFCVFFFVLGGCASSGTAPGKSALSASDLLDGTPFGAVPGESVPELDLLATNAEMRAFLDDHVDRNAAPQLRVRQILRAILDQGLYLRYDNLLTLTAQEAFYVRSGNCMSFTNLFIALAREAGIRARYQEVKVPPNWSAGDSTLFYNLHVNVLVDLPGAEEVIDFNLSDYDSSYPRRVLKDVDGEALHHNNMGVYWMTEGDVRQAFLHYRRAIELRPGTGHFWTNLGTLFRRSGDTGRAEAAFLRAIELSNEPIAMSNLARLYNSLGEKELAMHYESQISLFRRKNPYYLFHLAEEAYAAADYSEAESLLRKALRRHSLDERFHHLLAMVYLQNGDILAAKRRLRQAAELAEGDDRARLSEQLELLAGETADAAK